MTSIKELLANNKTDEAVDRLLNGLLYLINSMPGVQVTKDEFNAVLPTLTKKLEDPASVVPEPTEAPGDDTKLHASKGTLVVKFIGPKGDSQFPAPDTYVKTYTVGDEYELKAPVIPGYIASPEIVSGVMDPSGVTLEIAYSKVENPPLYGTVSIINAAREVTTDLGTVENASGDEVWVYYEGEIEWNSMKNDADGQSHDIWMAGYRIDCPKELTEEADYAGVYTETVNDVTGVSGGKYLFSETQNATQKEQHFNNCWLMLDQDKMQTAFDSGTKLTWTASYDWNGDGGYEQVVHLVVDPEKVTLADHDGEAWPKKPEPAKVAMPELDVKVEEVEKKAKPKKAKKAPKVEEAEIKTE